MFVLLSAYIRMRAVAGRCRNAQRTDITYKAYRAYNSEIYQDRIPDCWIIKMFSYLISLLLLVSSVAANWNSPKTNGTHLHRHDSTFSPNFYLHITYENHTVACQHRMSVLVNGTSPGPTLRLPGGKTSWVRVCNDMDTYNTTMVTETFRTSMFDMLTFPSTGTGSLNAPHLLVMAHQSANGLLRRTNASTMRYILSPTMLERTFITHTSASRP